MKKGWRKHAIGELGRVFNGNSINEIEKKACFEGLSEGLPYIGTKDVTFDYEIIYDSGVRIPDSKQDYFKLVPANSILVCAEGGSAGRKIAHTNKEVYFGNKLYAICPTPLNSSKFVFYYFLSDNFSKQFKSAMTGLIGGVSLNKFKGFQIPLPTFHEQQRIVAILDEIFEDIAIAKTNAEMNLKNARNLFESHRNAIFTGHGEGWIEKKLGDKNLLEFIDGDRGVNYPKTTDFYEEGFCLFLNTKNVRPDGFKFDITTFITSEKDGKLRKGKLQRNDIVLTTRGTIGNIGIYSEDIPFENIRINSGMLILRTSSSQGLLPCFLFELLRSEIIKDQIRRQTTGAAQPQLPIKTLVNFTIPVPKCLRKQQTLVNKINALESDIKNLESIYQQKIDALEALKKSLLHQAFTGNLKE